MSREIGMLREIGISRPPKQSPVHTMIPKSPQSPKEFDSSGGLTSLEPDTVRYLNKRKPMDKSRASMYTFHTTRANAVSILYTLIIMITIIIIMFYRVYSVAERTFIN